MWLMEIVLGINCNISLSFCSPHNTLTNYLLLLSFCLYCTAVFQIFLSLFLSQNLPLTMNHTFQEKKCATSAHFKQSKCQSGSKQNRLPKNSMHNFPEECINRLFPILLPKYRSPLSACFAKNMRRKG